MLWLWLAGCGAQDEVRLYAEGDGALCVDEALATLTVWQDCALTCAGAEWIGRCEAAPANTADGDVVLQVQSEILVSQPDPCPTPTCVTVQVSCPLPPDTADLPLVWGLDYQQGTAAELAGECPFEAAALTPTTTP